MSLGNRLDPAVRDAYRRALQRRGQRVIVQRILGYAPNSAAISVEVDALVADVIGDAAAADRTGYRSTEPGGITQDNRNVIVMAQDLELGRFPLPVQKRDKVILMRSGEQYDVATVDLEKRSLAGAIDLTVTGVA